MNKLEDFTEGSEWYCHNGFKLKFHSFDESDGFPLFTSEKHCYSEFQNGTIGFYSAWKKFTKINQ